LVVSKKSSTFAPTNPTTPLNNAYHGGTSFNPNMAQQRVNIKDSALGQLLSKMIDDKKAISEYIRKNGTLDGFAANGIKFAQPL